MTENEWQYGIKILSADGQATHVTKASAGNNDD